MWGIDPITFRCLQCPGILAPVVRYCWNTNYCQTVVVFSLKLIIIVAAYVWTKISLKGYGISYSWRMCLMSLLVWDYHKYCGYAKMILYAGKLGYGPSCFN